MEDGGVLSFLVTELYLLKLLRNSREEILSMESEYLSKISGKIQTMKSSIIKFLLRV